MHYGALLVTLAEHWLSLVSASTLQMSLARSGEWFNAGTITADE